MDLLPQNMNEWMRSVRRDIQELRRHRHPSSDAQVADLRNRVSDLEDRTSALEGQVGAILDRPWRSMITGQGQTVPHNAWTGLEGLTGTFGDPGDGRITHQGSGEFQITEAGVYTGEAQVSFDADSASSNAGTRGVRVLWNGEAVGFGISYDRQGSQNTIHCNFKGFLPAAALIQVEVYQGSGDPLDVQAADWFNRFTIERTMPG